MTEEYGNKNAEDIKTILSNPETLARAKRAVLSNHFGNFGITWLSLSLYV
jgi:hypothetical protein